MKFQKLLVNRTYASVHAEPMLDRHGADVVAVIAKLALAFGRTTDLSLSARPIRHHDEVDGRGGIKLPCDLAAEMPGTSIGLVGTLVPPEREPEGPLFAWLRIGTLGKAIHVRGPRVFMSGLGGAAPGPAGAAGRTPLVHALCYGGTDEDGLAWSAEMLNPTGLGYAMSAAKLAGRPAPQIEPAPLPDVYPPPDTRSLAARAQSAFAPIPVQWEPRRSRGGTEDEKWRRTRAPVLPEDYDPKMECWAPHGLWSETPLKGSEAVEIGGLRPGAPFRFRLPGFAPAFQSIARGLLREHETHLDGVLFDFDEGIVELTWRASVPLPQPWAHLERLAVLPQKLLPPEIVDRPKTRGSTE